MGEAALWSWSEAAGKAHLEVRAATRGEGPVVRIDGPVARADRDWIYWRLPTVVTAEAFDCSRPEASVRLDRGNVRVGALTADVRLGENWCEPTLVGKAFFLDAFFGVLRDGDAITAQSLALKAAMGDVITVRLLVEAGVVEFLINSASVGKVPVDPRREMKVAVQMWDKGDCVYLVGAKEKVRASKSKEHDASNTSFGQSPIKSAAATPRVPALGVEPTVSHPSKHSPSATPPSVRSRGTPRRQAGIVSGDKREPSSTSNGHNGGEGGHAAEGQQETAAVLPSVDPLSSEEHGEAMGLPSTQLSQHEVEQNGGSGDDVAGAQEEIAAGSSSLDGELPSAPIPSDQVLDRPDSSSGIATEGAPQPSSSAEDGAEEDGGGVYDGSGLTPAALEAHGKDSNDEAKNEEAALASEIPDGGASTEVESSHAPAQEFSTAGEENHSAAVGAIQSDDSGKITMEVLRSAMQKENPTVTEDDVAKRFAELDVDGDGVVTSDEIKARADRGAVVGRKVRKWFDEEADLEPTEEDADAGNSPSQERAGQEFDGEITEIWTAEDGKKFWRVKFEEGCPDDEEDYTEDEIVQILIAEE